MAAALPALLAVGAGASALGSVASLFQRPKGNNGPSGEEKALAAKNKEELARRNAEEKATLAAKKKITGAAQSRRGVGTLFRRSGEQGVKLGETRQAVQ